VSRSRAVADNRWAYNGLKAVVLENRFLRLTVLPEAGGKLLSLEDRAERREWLWRNPRIAPERASVGDSFDDHWSGGADTFFPTCYPCSVDGLDIPDSGEWWNVPWEDSTHEDEAAVRLELRAGGRVFPVESLRRISLGHDARHLRVDFSIRNVGHAPLPFLIGFHPALQVVPGSRIHLPPGTAQVDESSGGSMGHVGQRYRWPMLPVAGGDSVDMGVVRGPEAGQFAGHFLFPDAGRAFWALTDPGGGAGLGLWASEAFTGLWLWQVYGGWRGYYHVALEPWTGHPITLSQAVEAGTACWIKPDAQFHASIVLVCFRGFSEVLQITEAGDVQGV